MTDLVQTQDYDLEILGGDLRLGETTLQEVDNILISMQGNFKSAPLIGPNFQQLLNSAVSDREIKRRTKIQLALDNKNYDDIKTLISLNLKMN